MLATRLRVLITNDANAAIGFKRSILHLGCAFDSIGAKLTLQFVFGEHFPSKTRPLDPPMADKRDYARFRKSGEPSVPEGHPVDPKVPTCDRGDKNESLAYGFIFTSHSILRGVGNQYDDQDVRQANRSGVAPKDETKEEEQKPID